MATYQISSIHDVEAQQQQQPDAQDEKKAAVVTATEQDSSTRVPELRPAHTTLYLTAFVDVLIALLPLYFVAFAIVAYVRNDTLASSFRNEAILRMAQLVRSTCDGA